MVTKTRFMVAKIGFMVAKVGFMVPRAAAERRRDQAVPRPRSSSGA
jgi:hypothetical protein